MTITAMPAALLGMDTQEVSALGNKLLADADAMDQVATATRGLVEDLASRWYGADSQQFCAQWMATYQPALVAIAAGLRAHGRTALEQAAQQEQASAAAGGAAAGTAGLAGALGYGAAPGTAGRPTDRDLLALAGGSYNDSGDVVTANGTFHRLTPDELRAKGIDPSSLNTSGTGFAAALYRGPDGRYVLAYRGTQFKSLADWGSNVSGAVGISPQSVQAVALAKQVQGVVGAGNLDVTGHSLGGRLAAVASIATGAHATTFNAAGVSDAEFAYSLHAGGQNAHLGALAAKYAAINSVPAPVGLWMAEHVDPFSAERAALTHGQISAYHVRGEVLSTAQDWTPAPNALGSRTALPEPGDGAGTIAKHGVEEIEKSWQRAYPADH